MNVIEFIIRLKDKASGEAKKATESFQESKRAMDELRLSSEKSVAANNTLRNVQKEVAEATEKLAKAVRDLNEARAQRQEGKALQAEFDQIKAKDELTQAFKRLHVAERNANDAAKDVAANAERVRSLQGTVTKSVSASSREFQKLGRAMMSIARGNGAGAITALSSLSPVLLKAIPIIGTAIAALMSLRKHMQELFKEKFDTEMSDMKNGLSAISEQAKSAANEVKHLREETARLYEEQSRKNKIEGQIDASDFDIEEAHLRTTTANRLANVTDPEERARIEDEAARKRFDIMERRIRAEAEREKTQQKIEIERAEKELAAAEKEYASMRRQMDQLGKAYQNISEISDKNANGKYLDWAQRHKNIARLVDPLKTGFGIWGQGLNTKIEQSASIQEVIDEIQKRQDSLTQEMKTSVQKLKGLRSNLSDQKNGVNEAIDAKLQARLADLYAKRAEYDSKQTQAEAQKKARAAEQAESDAKEKAAKEAEEAAKAEEKRKAEIEKINDEIRSAEIQKLKNVIRASEAAGKDADARLKAAQEAELEARSRKLGMDSLDAKDAARKAAKEEAKKERRYENMKDHIRKAWSDAKKFNPGITDDELIKKMPRKWRDVIEQERQKQSDIDAAVAKQNEAQKEKMEAEERRLEAEKKLEERWGYVEDIDKVIKSFMERLEKTMTVNEAAGENG